MSTNSMFGKFDEKHDVQAGLGLDDGAGIRVVSAKFLTEEKFSWELFDDFDSLRVLNVLRQHRRNCEDARPIFVHNV